MQRAVDDVAVAGDPSDVGGTPVGVFFFQIEDPFGGEVGADGISAGGVHDAFGFSGGAGGVEDVERMLGVERLGGADVGSFRHKIVPPVITALDGVDGGAGAFVDDDVFYAGTGFKRFFDGGKKFDFGAAAIGSILGDDGGGAAVVNAIDEGVGGESAEDDGVRRADAGAGQHGDGQLRSHAHVDGDTVAFFYAKAF